jgi:hypothetical protein
MSPSLMRFLILSLFILLGCASEYKGLTPSTVRMDCIEKLKPATISLAWYSASIDVVGKHISGLLLMKQMPDSSYRVVFTNEAGIKFLDFEFASNGEFKVHHVLKQLDHKAVIRLLKADFALVLGIPFQGNNWIGWKQGNEVFYGVSEKKETVYFITDPDCASLQRIESASRRKRMVTLKTFGDPLQQPDSIHLRHHTFAMEINLKKLLRE